MSILSQICALTILISIVGFYAAKRKIQLKTGRNYMQLVVAAILCVSFDLLSIYFIEHRTVIPDAIVFAVCKLYLVTLILVTGFGLRYIFSDIYKDEKKYKRSEYIVGAWLTLASIIVMALRIDIHYTDGVPKYTEGPATTATYTLVVINILSIIFFLLKNKADINMHRRNAVFFWIGIWVTAAAIQFFNSEILIVSFGATLGIMVIYFALENPESNIDRITGLFNENALGLYCGQKFDKKENFALFGILIDSGAGSAIGNIDYVIIKEVLDYLNTITKGDLFRITGNDYIMVFEDGEDAEEAMDLVVERMRYSWGKNKTVTLNCHFAYLPDSSVCRNVMEMQEIYNYAYMKSKESTKPFIVNEAVIAEMYEEHNMEHVIKDAIDNDRLEPFFQPIYNVATGRISSAEALVRIRKDDGTYISPNQFIPLAERTGMIITLGEVMFEKVCRYISREKPFEKYGLEYIEVNLSAVQAGYENLADNFIGIMEREHVEPRRINLEITESAAIADRETLMDNLEQLRLYGVTFSLDDFGTGFSNLNYVMDLPVNIVKFDREMTRKYFMNDNARRLMSDTIRMLKGMGLSIVSEGVENEKMLAEMISIGVDYIQGYYFAAPLPRREFNGYLVDRLQK